MNIFTKIRRKRVSNKNRNKTFTIFSSNCIGGVITSELGIRFNTPFIDLWLYPKDYIKFLKNPTKYLNQELKFCNEKDINYPIGILGDIKIYFYHYKSEKAAKLCWNRRKKRINYDNLFIIFTDRDGCSYQDLKDFDKLPYKNKIVFTHKHYSEIKSSFYIKGYETNNEVGNLIELEGFLVKKHIYERFNYLKWLNS